MTHYVAASGQTIPVHRLLFRTIFLLRYPVLVSEYYSGSTKVMKIVSTASTLSQGRSEKISHQIIMLKLLKNQKLCYYFFTFLLVRFSISLCTFWNESSLMIAGIASVMTTCDPMLSDAEIVTSPVYLPWWRTPVTDPRLHFFFSPFGVNIPSSYSCSRISSTLFPSMYRWKISFTTFAWFSWISSLPFFPAYSIFLMITSKLLNTLSFFHLFHLCQSSSHILYITFQQPWHLKNSLSTVTTLENSR